MPGVRIRPQFRPPMASNVALNSQRHGAYVVRVTSLVVSHHKRSNNLCFKLKSPPPDSNPFARILTASRPLSSIKKIAFETSALPCGIAASALTRNLIRTLPTMCYDSRHVEDIDGRSEDHCVDALRYGLTRVKHFFRSVRTTGL